MNDIFMLIAFLVLVGLLVSRMTQEGRGDVRCIALRYVFGKKSEQNIALQSLK